MPNSYPAYQAGEVVFFKSHEELLKLQGSLGREGPQGEKLIHDVLTDDWTAHAGVRVRVKASSIYHMGIILYEFDEIEGHWLEDSIVDASLVAEEDNEFKELASKHYEIKCELDEGYSGIVQIIGKKSQQIFCSFRKDNAEWARASIEEVSKLRAKISFEELYRFDGLYEPTEIFTEADYVDPINISQIVELEGGNIELFFNDSNENVYAMYLYRSDYYINTEYYNRFFVITKETPLSEEEEQRLGKSITAFQQTYSDEIDEIEVNAIDIVLTMIKIPQADRPKS